MIRAGARGYVTKTISGPDLADAVQRVREGDAVFSPGWPFESSSSPAVTSCRRGRWSGGCSSPEGYPARREEAVRSSRIIATAAVATACALGTGVAPAFAAKSCPEPGESWQRATPAEAGMDAAKLQDAMDYGSTQLSFAVRVYRRGCLVAEDRLAPVNRTQQYESYSMAKSITSVMFGRAMQQGLIGPDDPVGALVTEADRPHGAVTLRNLLTMTSGWRWNGFRDYNIFTMPDRIRDALTLEVVRRRGTYFEYAQSSVSLLAEATGRAAGKDAGAYAQQELMSPLGIEADSWYWKRDPAGHIGGFYGVNMRPDDFGRFGELLRRGGMWRGRRLVSTAFMEEALQPTKTNGCYGWLIWLNRDKPCVGARVTERPVDNARSSPICPPTSTASPGSSGSW